MAPRGDSSDFFVYPVIGSVSASWADSGCGGGGGGHQDRVVIKIPQRSEPVCGNRNAFNGRNGRLIFLLTFMRGPYGDSELLIQLSVMYCC